MRAVGRASCGEARTDGRPSASRTDGVCAAVGRALASRSATVVVIVAVAAALGALAGAVLLRDDRQLPAFPLIDDSLYYSSVADHLSRGELRVGAQGEYENGFQPLQAALLTPVMLVARWLAGAGDHHYLGLRLTFAVHLALLAALVALFTIVVRRLVGPWSTRPTPLALAVAVTGVAVLGNPRLVRETLNGLETGLTMVLALAIIALVLAARPPRGENVLVPLLCGLLILARIDTVILAVGLLGVWEWLRGRLWRPAMLVDWSIVVLAAGWWFVVNLAVTGNPLPASGQAYLRGAFAIPVRDNAAAALRTLGTLGPLSDLVRVRVDGILSAVGGSPAGGLDLNAGWAVLVLSVMAMTLCLVVRAARAKRRLPRAVAGVAVVAALYAASLVVFYVGFFGTTWFIDRYLTPISLLATLVEAVLVTMAVCWALERPTRRACSVVLAVAVLMSAALVGRYGAGLRHYADPEPVPTYRAHYALVRDLSDDAVVAAWQSGTLSYFRPTTINLGGKMNRDAADAYRTDTLLEYMRASRIEYVVDWDVVVDWRAPSGFEEAYEVVATRVDGGLRTDLWRARRPLDSTVGD